MIPLDRIARLAEFYDNYNNALNPLAPDALEAKRRFDELTDNLHAAHGPDTSFADFRYEIVRRCREYLRKN